MKKSEMIKKLTDYLHKQDYYVTTNKVQCEYLVELILNKAEKLGILQPVISLCEGETLTQKQSKDMFEQAWDDYQVGWEDED